MNTVGILLPNENDLFGDLAKALQLSFMELGWTSMWLGDKDHVREYAREIDLAVVLTPLDYKDIDKLLPKATKVLYQLEALPWPTKIHLKRRKYWGWGKIQPLLTKYDAIWEFDEGNIKEHWKWFRREYGRPVHHCPIGYSRMFELLKRVKKRDRAVFIGSTSDHPKQKPRMRTLRRISGRLKKRMQIVSDRYGDKARQTAKNARVCVNVHENIPVFEGLRMIGTYMSNKCFVVTAPCTYLGPFKHLEHLCVTKSADMPSEISYYLQAPWECERMSENAYNFIKKSYTMTQHVQAALKKM